MQVSKNEITGNTMLTLDEYEMDVLRKCVWDEMLMYKYLINNNQDITNDVRERYIERESMLNKWFYMDLKK